MKSILSSATLFQKHFFDIYAQLVGLTSVLIHVPVVQIHLVHYPNYMCD